MAGRRKPLHLLLIYPLGTFPAWLPSRHPYSRTTHGWWDTFLFLRPSPTRRTQRCVERIGAIKFVGIGEVQAAGLQSRIP